MAERSEVRAALVDAFTDEPLSGNAAGVVPEAASLVDGQFQAVARELAVSETAFFLPSEVADRRVRYFTPTTEVDLCGHATVAGHAYLLAEGAIGPGTHSLETNAGVVDVDVEADGSVRLWRDADAVSVREVDLDRERVAGALGVEPAAVTALADDLPLSVAAFGLAFLVVPVSFLEALGDADPDLAAVEDLCASVDATGVYAFTFDTLSADATLHGRMFAPGAGVPEDPVTGTASGAVAAYLDRVGAFGGGPGAVARSADEPASPDSTVDPNADVTVRVGRPAELVFEQGHFLERPGRVSVRFDGDAIGVGGRAATAFEGTLSVPADDGDDIVEA